MKKYDENVHWKLVPDLYLIFRNTLEYSRCIQKSLVNKIFGKKIIKNSQKNLTSFFLNSIPLYGHCYKKT